MSESTLASKPAPKAQGMRSDEPLVPAAKAGEGLGLDAKSILAGYSLNDLGAAIFIDKEANDGREETAAGNSSD